MNKYRKIFKISAPPTQLIFYKNKENFSCGPAGIPYFMEFGSGVIKWSHNVNVRHVSDHRHKYRDKIRFIGNMGKRMRNSAHWEGKYDTISRISEYSENYLDVAIDLIRKHHRYGD